MSLKKLAPVLILLIVAVLPAFAQRDSIGLATIVSKTDKLAAEHPFEKVYLHFDKPYYAVGDTIWFKAYLTVGPKHQLSGLSHIIYVDVLTNQDSLVRSLKLYASTGIGFGDIALTSPSFKQGNYHIRAYTNWMRNFSPDYFFKKTVGIGDLNTRALAPKISFRKTQKNKDQLINASLLFKGRDGNLYPDKKVTWTVESNGETIYKGKGNTDKNGFLAINFVDAKLSPSASIVTIIELSSKKSITSTFPLKTVMSITDVQFFPEGGELISGVRSKIAFKAVNADGLGIDVNGTVTDNAGNEVASFTSQHAGMGIFPLLPQGDKTYKATVNFPDGSKGNFELPKVRSGGITLAVNNNDPDNLNIKIATNEAYFKAYQNKGFYIVAQSGGTIYYAGLAALQSLVYTAAVPKSKFPTGILQLTLFAADGEPLSERIVFIKHNDELNLTLNANLAEYKTRQHVTMNVVAKSTATPVEGTFSIAVIDESKASFDEDAETTILSSFLLTSDLKGYIEKPNYYFHNADSKTLGNLDILMLTQGYRRFSYTDLLADKYPPFTYLPESGIDISGTLRTSTGLPVNRGNVNLTLSDRNNSQNAITDVNGQFKFTNLSVFDSTKMVLSGRSGGGSNDLMIVVDQQPNQPIAKGNNNPDEITNIDSTLTAYLQNNKKQIENSHVLKEVVIKGDKVVKSFQQTYAALKGLSFDADQVLTAASLKDCSFDFKGCVLGRVFGLWHVDNNYYVKSDYDKGNKKPVKFFVNGASIDVAYIDSMNPADVESMDVYFKDGITKLFDFYQCNGIISITTKTKSFDPAITNNKPDLSLLTSQTSSVTITPKGFYRPRIFYSPKYTNPQNAVQHNVDLRTTIYWNPNIITDKNGNATLDFYNADGQGTYRAVIEGIDYNGNIGRFVLKYVVK